MNTAQEKAIKSLERAFKKCSDAGLCFFGNGSEFMCFDSKEFGEVTERLESEGRYHFGVGASEYSIEMVSYVQINTHRTLYDSGGA